MRIRDLTLFACTTMMHAQAVFYPTPRPKDLVVRFFNESPVAANAKKHGFRIRIDEEKGRIDYGWIEKNKQVYRTEYMHNHVKGSIECRVAGETLPLDFTYCFSFNSPCKEASIAWTIKSRCKEPSRFSTPSGKSIRMNVDGFDVYAKNGFSPSQDKGYPNFFFGDASRSDRKPVDNFSFNLSYKSYCLPRVVPCGLTGSRQEQDSSFSENDPDFLNDWTFFLVTTNKVDFRYEHRLTLGPGLDAEKATASEMIDELIQNLQTAKSDNWIPWAEGGEPLMSSLNEVKFLITNQRKKELPRKLDEAMQRLESLKGKGRSEFYPMVRTYLVFLKKKAAV